MNPVKQIYGDIHREARDASETQVYLCNLATGAGKTHFAHETACEALLKAKADNESLVIVYIAPQHGQIDISHHSPHRVQEILKKAGIPAVKIESKSLLTNPDEPHNLYRFIHEQEAQLENSHADGKPKHGRPPSLIQMLQAVPFRYPDLWHIERLEKPPEETWLRHLLAEIKRQEASLRRYRREGEEDLHKTVERLQEEHGKLHDLILKAIKVILNQVSRPKRQLATELGDQALIMPFQRLKDLLFPWYDVVCRPGPPLGLVAMTAARLMTRHEFPLTLANKERSEKGQFTSSKFYLEDAIHGLKRGAQRIIGLKDGTTRFMFLIDEADAVKTTLDEPALSVDRHSRMHLKGMFLDHVRATQVGQSLFEQLPLVFADDDRIARLTSDLVELFEQYPELAGLRSMTKVAALVQAPAPSKEARRAVQRLRNRHKLGSIPIPHLMQQMALREQLLHLLDQQYREHSDIQGSSAEKLKKFRLRLEALCCGVPLINLNLDDPTAAAAGSTGAFTAGAWGFININDERLDGLVLHRQDELAPDAQIVSQDYLMEEEDATPGELVFPLADGFEIMLSIAGIIHLMVEGDEAFSILRHSFRPNNETSSAPVTDMIKRLQQLRVRELMEVRRPVDTKGVIDDDLAFRTPHLLMQWVPDFKDRYLLGEIGLSVIPAIGFRAWSAEHHIERLLSPNAYLVNTTHSSRPQPNAVDEECQRQRPAHSAVLISATGGFPATHLGGFCGDMLAHSPHLSYHPMSERELELAGKARDLRHTGTTDKLGRPMPEIAAISDFSDYGGLLADNYRPRLLDSLEDTLGLDGRYNNPHKAREARRVFELIYLLGVSPTRFEPSLPASPELYRALTHILGDGHQPPCMSLMLIQSLKTPLMAFRALSENSQSPLTEIIPAQLYGYRSGNRRHPSRPVLIVAFRSGRAENTDACIDAMLNDQPGHQSYRTTFKNFISNKVTGEEFDIDSHFPKRENEEDRYTYGIGDLLRRDIGCHTLVVSAYESAGMGLNLKVDTHLEGGERDLDLLALGMSPHYTKARPKYVRYKAPPGPNQPLESDTQRSKRENQNAQAFKDNNAITHDLAMTGIELTSRLNRGRWGAEWEWPSESFRVKDIRLHPESYLSRFQAFLQEQHYVDLARKVFQATGRAERTQCSQQQVLLVCPEIITALSAADHILYGKDAHGQSRESLMNSISLNSYALMRYMRRRRTSFFAYPSGEDQLLDMEEHLQKTNQAFTEDRSVRGWKNQQLSAIDAMNRGELSKEDAKALVTRWEAWRSPCLLFPATHTTYLQRAEEAGVPFEILSLMWLNLPRSKHLPVVHDGRFGWRVALRAPKENVAAEMTPYPPNTSHQFQLPEGLLEKWRTELHGHGWDVPAYRRQNDKGEGRVLHPILQPDFKGIWGELAMQVWWLEACEASTALQGATRLTGLELIGIYELFDCYHELTHPQHGKVLVALDAKHFSRATDLHHGKTLLEDRRGKRARVREWARQRGYAKTITAYLNTQPSPQELARNNLLISDALTLNAFSKIYPTDVNAPHNVPFGIEPRRSASSPLVEFNQSAALRLEQAITETAH